MASTVSKWVASVPRGFQFTFKLSKTITHSKDFVFKPEDIDHFMEVIDHTGNQKGCILVQFPPDLKIKKIKQVQKLLTKIQKVNAGDIWKLAIEFRDRSWYHQDTYDLLNEYKAALVIHDLPASVSPIVILKTNFMYLRFHGPGGRYRGSYDDELLRQQAQHILAWIKKRKTVYVYFNNTMGDAVKNLKTLNSFLITGPELVS